jgi:two-component system response regulator FixJ
MTLHEPIVFVVDDDHAMCESLQYLLESNGLRVRTFPSAEAFLQAYDPDVPGCLVLDIRMHGMSGLDLQAHLAGDGIGIPVIILTGHGDVPMAVQALRTGALDFLEKPVNAQLLIERIRDGLQRDVAERASWTERRRIQARRATLTPRERQVLELVVIGYSNKETAAELGIAEKTVEVHRKRVMQKMRADRVVELVRSEMMAHGVDPASDQLTQPGASPGAPPIDQPPGEGS